MTNEEIKTTIQSIVSAQIDLLEGEVGEFFQLETDYTTEKEMYERNEVEKQLTSILYRYVNRNK